MAEFCLTCWNKINNSNLKRIEVLLSKEKECCEECRKIKKIIIRYRKWYTFKENVIYIFKNRA